MKVNDELRNYLKKFHKNVTNYDSYEKRLIEFEEKTENKEYKNFSEEEKTIYSSLWKEFDELEEERVILKIERYRIEKQNRFKRKKK